MLHAFDRLVSMLNGIGTVGIVLLMVVINADVFSRWLLGQPIDGVPEIVKLTIVAVVFLQAPHTQAVGRLTSSEIFMGSLEGAAPRVAAALKRFYALCGAALFAVIIGGAWPQLTKAYERGEYAGAQGVFTVPTWPVKAVVVVGCTVMVLQFLRELAVIRTTLTTEDDPRAVERSARP